MTETWKLVWAFASFVVHVSASGFRRVRERGKREQTLCCLHIILVRSPKKTDEAEDVTVHA